MEVLSAAAEAVPFIKSGGLGDVVGSLPGALKKEKIETRVIVPLYGGIPARFKDSMTLLKELTVPLAWRKQYCGLKRLDYAGITYYFIDNEYYFKRDKLYGFNDDAERFAYFSKAVLECLPYLDFSPQIIHCHDWHTGLISVFLHAFYQGVPFYDKLKKIITIHNLAYQGVFDHGSLGDVLGLGDEYYSEDKLRFYEGINYLKGGICFSDIITTVSKTYAKEIRTPFLGEKLDSLLEEKSDKLRGIINGLDYDTYNPLTDQHIFCKYRSSLDKKAQNKLKLQEILGLTVNRDVPVLAVVSRLAGHKGFDLFIPILEEILEMEVQLVVLGTGEKKYEKMFLDASNRYPGKMAARIMFDETMACRIYAGSDIFLMPSLIEPCGLGQLIALRYGSVPVVRETGGLKDTIKPYEGNSGTGNGFCFKNYSASEFLFTIKRAVEYYRDKTQWPGIVKNALKSDYSWTSSAQEYKKLYQEIVEN